VAPMTGSMPTARARLRQFARRPYVLGVAVAVMMVGSTLAVYAGGGTKTPWPHLFYLPIVVAAGVWGMRAGVVTGAVAGVLSGPIMPLDVAAGTAQPLTGWTLRAVFFTLVAVTAASSRDRILALAGARQELLSAVSHEVRTPLAAVLGFSQLVLDRYDELTDDECREFAALINQEATELSNVIDHYVLEGRLKHKLIVDIAEVDLRQIVDIVLAGIPREIRDTRMIVTGDDIRVQADPLRLRQIIRSLVNNSLAYGGSRIFILLSTDGRHGTVTINDMRPTDRGSRVERPSTAPLGVGLAVARELAELMGGRLLYRVEGRGTFELDLPLTPQPRQRPKRTAPTLGASNTAD